MLVGYGVLSAYLYGLLMNLQGWPFIAGVQVPGQDSSELSYVPGAPLLENLHHFLIYTVLTSTGGWDTGRAITNALAIALLGPAVLTTLRRAARRAHITRAEPTPTAR
jgi:energy-coupling factor transport system substrate-specific component